MSRSRRLVAVGLSPDTPKLSEKVFAALIQQGQWDKGLDWDISMQWGGLSGGLTFAKPKPGFPRLELKV